MGVAPVSFQIKDIVIYGPSGEYRALPLRTGAVNVITGYSETGKSALIDIIDYALGASECTVPDGPIRDSVRWYGLRLVLRGGEQVFIARRAPPLGRATCSEMHLELGADIPIPSAAELRGNSNPEAVVRLLGARGGMTENQFEPPGGSQRTPLEATIRHGLLYCFQRQEELLQRRYLFHRQGDPQMPQTIKDTLPYLLGVVAEGAVGMRQELRRLRAELRDRERRLAENDATRGGGAARALVGEAMAIGLIASESAPQSWEAALATLRQIAASAVVSAVDGGESQQRLDQLLRQQASIRDERRRIQDEIADTKAMFEEEERYGREAKEQSARLQSFGVFPPGDEHAATCPLCESHLPSAVPRVAAIRKAIDGVNRQLESVSRETPHLQQSITVLESRLAGANGRARENRDEIAALEAESQRVAHLRDQSARQSHVLGRISYFVETAAGPADMSELRRGIDTLKARIAEFEERLSDEATAARLDSVLSVLSTRLTPAAKQLGLEHSGNPVRLDLRKPTIVVDGPSGIPIPLDRIGSGANSVGYHLVTHLVLHQWFVEHDRPVPRFLVLDQPSEAFFPDEDGDAEADAWQESDRVRVRTMFRYLIDAVNAMNGRFQLIITEHADLRDPWYQEVVVHRWKRGEALVPAEWKARGAPESDQVEE